MRKSILIWTIIAYSFLLASCSNINKPAVCTQDVKVCPDGSAVSRVPPGCNFAECHPTGSNKSNCDYEADSNKKYAGKSQDECSRIKFICEQSMEYFTDNCGCGCKTKKNGTGDNGMEQHYCAPEEKKAEVCIDIYDPVCGWFDPVQIQCIRYPCAQTFSNSCIACADNKVLYWTKGECPK